MFKLEVQRQELFSRPELVLRTLLGMFYIAIPHLLAIILFIIWAKILWVYGVFVVLLTGKLPVNIFNYQLQLLRWGARLHLRVYNLVDGYPAFGLNGNSDKIQFEISPNEFPNRLTTLGRFVLVPIILIPHILVWALRNLISIIFSVLAFWVVLFTGKYPKKWFEFNVGTLRWIIRVFAYVFLLTEDFPPFSGKP